MQPQRTLGPKTAVSLAAAVGAASTKAAIVSIPIPTGSMNAVNGVKALELSTVSQIVLGHHFSNTVSTSGTSFSTTVGVAVAGVGGVEMQGAMLKGADFNFKASSAFSFTGLYFSMSSSGSTFSSGGIGHGLRLIPVKFTDDSGKQLLGLAEVDFDVVSNPGYANMLNFWYSDDEGVEGLRWDESAQMVFEVGPTAVPEPRGAAAVLLAGLAAVAQSRRRNPQARTLGALAAGMGGLVARAGREDS